MFIYINNTILGHNNRVNDRDVSFNMNDNIGIIIIFIF